MDYEKKYKEALERAKEIKSKIVYSHLSTESCKAVSEYIDTIIPELTESEDERMADMVLKALDAPDAQSCIESWGINPKDVKNWFLAYLEKQKEQKPLKYLDKKKVYAVMTKLNNLSYSQLIPINSDEYKKLNEITSDVRDLLDYPIEQKPAEKLSKEEYVKKFKALCDSYEIKLPNREYDIYGLCDDLHKLFGDVQKSAEWGDSFEENIRNLLHDKLTGHSKDGAMTWTTLIDDKTLKDIVNGIWFYVGKEALKYPNKELDVSEWSEEEFEIFRKTLAKDAFLDEITSKRVAKKLLNSVKSLRPQSHWKPSKEQMEALLNTLHPDNPYYITLRELYDDLKTLI